MRRRVISRMRAFCLPLTSWLPSDSLCSCLSFLVAHLQLVGVQLALQRHVDRREHRQREHQQRQSAEHGAARRCSPRPAATCPAPRRSRRRGASGTARRCCPAPAPARRPSARRSPAAWRTAARCRRSGRGSANFGRSALEREVPAARRRRPPPPPPAIISSPSGSMSHISVAASSARRSSMKPGFCSARWSKRSARARPCCSQPAPAAPPPPAPHRPPPARRSARGRASARSGLPRALSSACARRRGDCGLVRPGRPWFDTRSSRVVAIVPARGRNLSRIRRAKGPLIAALAVSA